MDSMVGMAGEFWNMGRAAVDGAANLVFYSLINDFLRDEITEFQDNLVNRTMLVLGALALALLTLWIFYQGFRIVTGRSRDSMMGLVSDSLRATLIIGIATGFAVANPAIYRGVTDGLGELIYQTVTSDESDIDDMYSTMDRSLVIMNVAMARLDSLQTGKDEKLDSEKSRALWMAGLGTAGPAMAAGVMLTLNKVAMALFTGLGPLFVLCLLFDQTKSLFQRWLLYGIGTMFSLAVLYVMVILATDTVVAVATAFWLNDVVALSNNEGLKTIALQQGGLGLILTMLLISVPPMAAAFFQGTLGNFMHYNALSSPANNSPGPQGQPPGAYAPPTANQQAPQSLEAPGRAPAINPNGNPGRLALQQEQQPRDEVLKSADQARTPGNR